MCETRRLGAVGGTLLQPPGRRDGLGLALDLHAALRRRTAPSGTARKIWPRREPERSFLLTGSDIGLVGYGNLGRALRPLLAPFGGTIRVYDPWLPAGYLREQRCVPASLAEVLARSRVVFLLAGVTDENTGLIGRREIALMQPGTVVVLLSRAPLVDGEAFVEAARTGRIRAATDVFA